MQEIVRIDNRARRYARAGPKQNVGWDFMFYKGLSLVDFARDASTAKMVNLGATWHTYSIIKMPGW